jgi:hypothetical protein
MCSRLGIAPRPAGIDIVADLVSELKWPIHGLKQWNDSRSDRAGIRQVPTTRFRSPIRY